MAESDDQPTLVDLAALPASERRVLAGLAVVGQATLSTEEVAFLAEVEDVAPLLEDLRRRGLIKTDWQDRHGVLGAIGADVRRTNEALATGNRLIGFVQTLARGGKLTPARLRVDAEAILGLTEWAAEVQEWAELLELVETVQASFSLAEQTDQWIALLNSGLGAARMLGDTAAEAALLQHLSAASARAGDQAGARRYAQQADELRRGPVTYVATPPPPSPWTGGKIALLVAGFILVAVLGAGAGVLLAGNDDPAPSATIPVTLTIGGETSVTVETATLPAETVIETVVSTATETLTETLVTTETVVVTTTPTVTIG